MKSALLYLLILAACATAPRVRTDVAAGIDLSTYGTYAWFRMPETDSPLVRQRIVDAIDHALVGKQWRPSISPSVLLAVHVASQERQDFQTVYQSPQWHETWRHDALGVGDSHTMVQAHPYVVGTLIVDMLDARTGHLIRRATKAPAGP